MDSNAPAEDGFSPDWRGVSRPKRYTDADIQQIFTDLKAMLREVKAPPAANDPLMPCRHHFVESQRFLHTLECAHCGHMIEHPKRWEKR